MTSKHMQIIIRVDTIINKNPMSLVHNYTHVHTVKEIVYVDVKFT